MSLAEKFKRMYDCNDECIKSLDETNSKLSDELEVGINRYPIIYLSRTANDKNNLYKDIGFSLSINEALKLLNWLRKYEEDLIELAKK